MSDHQGLFVRSTRVHGRNRAGKSVSQGMSFDISKWEVWEVWEWWEAYRQGKANMRVGLAGG